MARRTRKAKPGARSLLRRIVHVILYALAASVAVVLIFRWVPPPGTALMVERKIQSWTSGEPIDLRRDWRGWDDLPDSLKLAVIAGEDQHFPSHSGFDLPAIRAALLHNEQGGSVRGASTISQQVAKNVFLWSGRSWVRKAVEAWFTLLIETLWSKERILEVYLNSVEWGPGIFGAQAAAQYHFSVDAEQLSAAQAARLAAVLPNPIRWSASRPSAYVLQRARWISRQMRQLGGASYLQQLN